MENLNINHTSHINHEPGDNALIMELIAQDNARLDRLVQQDIYLSQRLKARVEENPKNRNFILKLNLKLLGRTVATAMGLAFFIIANSLWIDKVSEKAEARKSSQIVTQWVQPEPVKNIHQAYSEVLQWEKQEK